MNGSEKQIKWAQEIKADIEAKFPDMSSNPMAQKAKDTILSQENASFWIDHRDWDPITMCRVLCDGGLYINGDTDGKRVHMNMKTGEVTVE